MDEPVKASLVDLSEAPVPEDFVVVRPGEQSETYIVYTVLGGPPHLAEGERDLDLTYAPILLEQIAEEIVKGQRAIILDLSPLVFIDSAGLQSLVAIRQRIAFNGRQVYVTGLQRAVKRVFTLMRLDTFMDTLASVPEAIAEVTATAAGKTGIA